DQLSSELGNLTRTHMKRKLLDTLAAAHDFAVPQSMVDAEFEQIWQQLEHEATHEEDPEAAKAGLEAERPEYRRIAERRVRLGLLLSEIGQQGGVVVTPAEMNRLIAQEASRYPKERDQVIKYFQENAMAAAQPARAKKAKAEAPAEGDLGEATAAPVEAAVEASAKPKAKRPPKPAAE